MRPSVATILARWVATAVALAMIIAIYTRQLHASAATVALTMLLLIQWLAASWGLTLAVAASLAASLCFNYFFLPPLGSFAIADAKNWVALGAFLVSALIGSNLANRLQLARAASERRSLELQLLYDFGQRLLAPDSKAELLRTLPLSVATAFSLSDAALYLSDDAELHVLHSAPPVELLQAASVASHPFAGPAPGSVLAPLTVGVRPIGSLYLAQQASRERWPDRGGVLPLEETLEAMSSLIALSIARAEAVGKLVQAEAGAESDRLRATLLDAVTHDLRTPLTSIKAAVTALLSQPIAAPERDELLTVIDEESDRLNHLIAQAVEMAELDAKATRLRREECDLASLFAQALETAGARWPHRVLHLEAAPALPPASVDPVLITRVLLHLVENAVKYTRADSPITVTLGAEGLWLVAGVADHGPGIPAAEHERIFNKFYRTPSQRFRASGSGMGLPIARAIVEAHGGALTLESTVVRGSTFRFKVPAAP